MAERLVRIGADELKEGSVTTGMVRAEAVSSERTWAGLARTEPGMASGWHHHGGYESVIYVLSGALRMEFGPGGTEVLNGGPGDFVYVPAHAVHRESNPAADDARIVVVRSGSGEAVFNVDGPEPEG